jgi:hypothetical protein
MSDSDGSPVQLYGWLSKAGERKKLRNPSTITTQDSQSSLSQVPADVLNQVGFVQSSPPSREPPKPLQLPKKRPPAPRPPTPRASKPALESAQPSPIPFHFGTSVAFVSRVRPSKSFFDFDFRDPVFEQFLKRASTPGSVSQGRPVATDCCDGFLMNAMLGGEFGDQVFDGMLYFFRAGDQPAYVELGAMFVSLFGESRSEVRLVLFQKATGRMFVDEPKVRKRDLRLKKEGFVQFLARLLVKRTGRKYILLLRFVPKESVADFLNCFPS